MANSDAWQAGVDIAGESKYNHKNRKKSANNGDNASVASSAKTASGGKNPWSILSYLPKLHSGGTVKKTGVHRLRKGELVLTKAQQKTLGIKHRGKKSSSRKRVSGKA